MHLLFRLFAPALAPLLLAAAPAPADTIRHGEGLLWQVSRDGAAPSHLLGTIHISEPRVREAMADAFAVLENAERLVIEAVMDQAAQAEALAQMRLADGQTLDTVAGADLYQETAVIASNYGIPEQVLRGLKPWAAAVSISLPRAELVRRAQGEAALDHALQAQAREAGLPVAGLETTREQLGVFDELPQDMQVAMLQRTVSDHDKLEAAFEQLVTLYLERRTGALQQWMARQMAGADPATRALFTERLIEARNVRMAERMEEHLAAGAALVAIGALHLPGEDGVLALLEDAGWRVTRAD